MGSEGTAVSLTAAWRWTDHHFYMCDDSPPDIWGEPKMSSRGNLKEKLWVAIYVLVTNSGAGCL